LLHLQGKWEQQRTLYQYIANEFPESDYGVLSQEDLVKSLCRHGDYPAAQQALEHLINRFRDHPCFLKSLYHVADIYDLKNQTAQAEKLYHWILEEDPQNPFAVYSQSCLISLHLRNGKEKEAQAALDVLFQLYGNHPTVPKALVQLAGTYADRKKYEQAEKIYHYVIENFRTHHYACLAQASLVNLYLKDGRQEKAQEALRKLFEEFADDSSLGWNLLRIRTQRKPSSINREEILTYVTKNYSTGSCGLIAHWYLAEFYIQQGNDIKSQEVIETIKTDYTDDPEQLKRIYGLAQSFQWKKKYHHAKEIYQYLIDSHPENTYAVQSIGAMLSLDLGQDLDESWREKLEQFFTQYADHPALPKVVLGVAQRYSEKGKRQQAIEIAQLLLKRYPQSQNSTNIIYHLSNFYMLNRDYRTALKYKNMLLEQYPHTEQGRQAPLSIAHMYRVQKRYDPCIAWLQKAIELHPDSAIAQQALYWLGFVCQEQKQYARAAAYYEQYFQSKPAGYGQSENMYHWAVCLDKTGQTDKAISVLQDALAKYGHDNYFKPEIEEKLQQLLNGKS